VFIYLLFLTAKMIIQLLSFRCCTKQGPDSGWHIMIIGVHMSQVMSNDEIVAKLVQLK
jgi:hypothetical protein